MRKARNKQKRYEELKTFHNVIERAHMPGDDLRGHWHDVFKNDNSIVLELACGKGDYTLSMAELFPDKNFVGIDIKGARLWKGALEAKEKELTNVRYLRIQIEDLTQYFAPHEVNDIWITFPDPHPTKKGTKKRLTSPRFLEMYKYIIKPNEHVHLKTDDQSLFAYSQESVTEFGGHIDVCLENIDPHLNDYPLLQIQTYYEKNHRRERKMISYLRWHTPSSA